MSRFWTSSGTITFGSLSETINDSGTHYLVIYDFDAALSADDQITAAIDTSDITTTAIYLSVTDRRIKEQVLSKGFDV